MPERVCLLRAGPLGLVLALLGACGAQSGQAEDRTAASNPLVVHQDGPKLALDPLGMFTPVASAAEPEPLLPELPLQELSDGLPPSGSWTGRPLLADFTASERFDLVASNCEEDGYSVWIGPAPPGQPWRRSAGSLPRGLGCGAACATDLDRDGHVDLVLSTAARGIRVFLGDGALNWRESTKPLSDTPPVAELRAGDLDLDGATDLVGIGYPRGGLQILFGDGAGGLRPAAGAGLLSEDDFGRDLDLADVDQDGREDIVVATGAGVRVFLNEASTPPRWREQSKGLPAPARPDSVLAVCVGRFTADPRPQIAVCCQPDTSLPVSGRDSIGVYGWNASKGAWEHVDSGLPRGDRYSDLRAADFDGDRKLDLVALSLEHGAAIYLGDGQGGFRAKGRLAGVHGRGRIAVGQVDRNSPLDLVLSVPAEKDKPEGGGVRAFLNRQPIWDAR